MKFEEFKSLIEERKDLCCIVYKYIYSINKEWKDKFHKIREIDQILFLHEEFEKPYYYEYLNNMKRKIEDIFAVDNSSIFDMFRSFFDSNQIDYSIMYNNSIGPLDITLHTQKDKYNLILNNSLKCLGCNDASYDWDKLLNDYPELKDYLWNEFKNIKNKHKEEEIKLVKKMIDKNRKEKRILTVPMFRENRINELDKERNELDDRLSNLKDSLEEIEI